MAEQEVKTQEIKPKRSWKKILLKTLVTVLIVLAVVLALAIWQIDRVAATGVRTVGSQLTGTPVEISDVSVNILNGVVKFNGFRVGNPAGFQNDSAVKVGKFHFDLDVQSLFGGDKVEIEHLELGGVALDYEYQFGGSNLDIIQRNVEKSTGADKKAQAEPKPQKQSKTQEPAQAQGEVKEQPAQKKVVIRKLILNDIRVTVSSKLTRTSFPLILPPIEMENVGEEGESLAAVIDEVLTKVITCIVQNVDFSKLGGSLKEAGQATLDAANKAAGGIGDAANKAGEAVQGLFQRGGEKK